MSAKKNTQHPHQQSPLDKIRKRMTLKQINKF